MLLNWPLKSEKISFKKSLGDPKIQQIVTAAIDDKFVNSREGQERAERGARSEEETRTFSYTLFLWVIISCLVSIPSVVKAAGGDDEEERENLTNFYSTISVLHKQPALIVKVELHFMHVTGCLFEANCRQTVKLIENSGFTCYPQND